MAPNERSMFASRSMPATSISISPMSAGAPSRSDHPDGASSARLRCAFAERVGMLPLPVPQKGGSIERLATFLNLRNRNDFVLVVADPVGAAGDESHRPEV